MTSLLNQQYHIILQANKTIDYPKRTKYESEKSKSTDFEVIETSNLDFADVISVNFSPKYEKEEYKPRSKSGHQKVQNIREESKFEKIKNIGTNMRYELGTLYQKISLFKQSNVHGNPKEYVLFGRKFNIDNDAKMNEFIKAYQDIIWFTYRKNFPILLDNKLSPADYYINDTGWGCMIRVCQMMLAESIKQALLDRIVITTNINEKIISLFLDSQTNEEESPYSIQNISKYLYEEFKLKPGQWFKASTIFLVINQIHSKHKAKIFERLDAISQLDLEIEIFLEGTIYMDKIIRSKGKQNQFDKNDHNILSEMKSDNSYYTNFACDFEEVEEDQNRQEYQQIQKDIIIKDFDEKVLVIVLAKIGLDQPNPDYFPFLKEYFKMPECIGMIGGRPGLAYYFVGYVEDSLVYLDPHFVQETIHSKNKLRENLQTYSCKKHRYVDMHAIDTSIAFGFLIHGSDNLKDFRKRFKEIASKPNSLLGIEDESPFEEISFEEDKKNDDFEEL